MKFHLDQTVIFEGEKVTLWDYSPRHREYDIKRQNGNIIYGLKENELTTLKSSENPYKKPMDEPLSATQNKCAGCGKEFTSKDQVYTITKGNEDFILCYRCNHG